MGYDIAGRKATIWDTGNVRSSTTTCATVATSVIKVLNHPNDTANKYLYISSFEKSMNSILSSLEKATGDKNGMSRICEPTTRSKRVRRRSRKMIT